MVEFAQLETTIRTVRFNSPKLIVMGSQCVKTGKSIVLRASGKEWNEPFEIGTTWRVSGHKTEQTLTRGEYTFKEEVVNLESAELILRNGEAFIRLLSESKKFSGIGRVKAQNLWVEFGENVFDIIEKVDIDSLKLVLSEQSALKLCKEFQSLGYIRALQILMSKPLPSSVCIDLVKAYGPDAVDRVKEDPYRLLTFIQNWTRVDDIARHEFGVEVLDSRRMRAAVNEALLSRFNSGNTAANLKQVKATIENTISMNPEFVEKALESEGGKLFKKSEHLIHPIGPWLMETMIAEKISLRLKRRSYKLESIDHIDAAIDAYENQNLIGLTIEQRDAIVLSAREPFSLILGGAGCGKTTVLKGVYRALQSGSVTLRIHQIALSGRAAQRMQESTGLPARTIAAFLQDQEVKIEHLGQGDVVVIDEASMIDVISAYYLMRRIPDCVQIILVGDPEQLPPVGPGLFLHILADHPGIPKTTLKVVKRQAEDSGIVAVSSAIRDQRIPEFCHQDIDFDLCDNSSLNARAANAYFALGGTGEDFSVVVVCPTKGGDGSTSEINSQIISRLNGNRPRVRTLSITSDGLEVVDLTINFEPVRLGDLVLVTKNDYTLEVRNGSLGKITRVSEEDPEDNDSIVCCIEVDGREVEFPVGKLDIIDHGYAVTVHKAQGSQFQTVIFPVRKSRLLDKSLVYTAITRAQSRCHILGDYEAFEVAVKNPSKATDRLVGLSVALEKAIT
jgi:exodeoxyribonuclease V alpha subunit